MSRGGFSFLRGAALIAALGAATASTAQEWSGQVTLYGWGAGVGGDFQPFSGAPELSFDKSLSDVLEDLDSAFFMTALARRGNFVMFGDLTYSSSSREGEIPPGVPASGEVTLRSVTLAAGRRFEADFGTVDLLGGLRGWRLDGRVEVPLVGVSRAAEKSFADPIVAVRLNAPLTPRWSALGYFDIGGFGAGSDLTWQAALTVNYQATDNLYVSAGWRHLYLDYSEGGLAFEGSMTGPLVGVTWRF